MALSPSVTRRLTREVITDLRSAGARAVSLYLDGATAATHDGFRGVDGVFDATLTAAEWVHEAGLRLQLNSTVIADNIDELPALLEQVVNLGAGLWSVFFLVSTGRGSLLNPADASTITRRQRRPRFLLRGPLRAGLPERLSACVGRLDQGARLHKIYRDAELLRALRDSAQLTGRCGRCDFRDVCGGSRSHAYAVFGDALAEGPSCSYEPTD